MLGGVEYLGVDDDGLRVRVDGSEQMLAVDHVVVCAGQESRRDLLAPLQAASVHIQVIGGADVAAELDAKREIAQAARVAAALSRRPACAPPSREKTPIKSRIKTKSVRKEKR